jgi:phage repressor protein C with HTH and peptisase S24 domain
VVLTAASFRDQETPSRLLAAGCFTRRSLPPIYIRGTRPPPTADETDTESEQEDRDDNESDHSIRPVTEREQEDRDEIESD